MQSLQVTPICRLPAWDVGAPLSGNAWDVLQDCVQNVSRSFRFAWTAARFLLIVSSSVTFQAMAYRQQVSQAAGSTDRPTPSQGWRAEDSLARVAAARASSWRTEHGMTADADFAFAFSSWEEAAAVGGHFLADEWLAVRVSQR